MKAKIRPHNLSVSYREKLDEGAREFFDARVDEYAKRLQATFAKRWLAATMLAANDQHGFGAKRGKTLIDGIMEIITGNCDDVYSKREIDEPGADKAYAAMAAELEDRGIILDITVVDGNIRADIGEKRKAP